MPPDLIKVGQGLVNWWCNLQNFIQPYTHYFLNVAKTTLVCRFSRGELKRFTELRDTFWLPAHWPILTSARFTTPIWLCGCQRKKTMKRLVIWTKCSWKQLASRFFKRWDDGSFVSKSHALFHPPSDVLTMQIFWRVQSRTMMIRWSLKCYFFHHFHVQSSHQSVWMNRNKRYIEGDRMKPPLKKEVSLRRGF